MKKRLIATLLTAAMLLSTSAFAAEYTVVKGDTLSKIALNQLGSASRWREIWEANKDTVKDPNKIVVGQKLTIPGAEAEPVPEPEPEPVPEPGTEPAGVTYTGVAMGFGGVVTAEVTVAGDKITHVTLSGPDETPAVGLAALPELAQSAMEKGADLDTVSGASYTSAAARAAVAEALAQAAGTASSTGEVKLKSGTYTSSGKGYDASVQIPVTVTISQNQITQIVVGSENQETSIILQSVKDLLLPRIIESQSVAVDSITGASASSAGVKEAVTNCLKRAIVAAGGKESDISAFQKIVGKVNEGVQKEMEADVVVVGMGAAGIAASISAAEQGFSVISVEKAGKVGGSSVMTSEPMGVNPEKFQEEFNNGEDYIDKEVMRSAWLAYTTGADGEQKANESLVDLMLDNCGKMIDWLVYEHGFKFSLPLKGFTPSDIYPCRYQYKNYGEGTEYTARNDGTQAMYNGIVDQLTALGNQVLLETEGTGLIYDADTNTVTGLIAKGDDGTEYTIKAKAVVLCTGGFAGNTDMVDQYITQNETFDFSTTGGWRSNGLNLNDGKMLRAAIAIGADTHNIDMPPMVHNVGVPTPLTQFDTVNGVTLNDIPLIMTQSGSSLIVGNDGKRFMNESSASMDGWMNGPEYYAIWSSKDIDTIRESGFTTVPRRVTMSTGTVPANVPIPQIDDVLEAAIQAGIAYKADTLEELAEKIGVPAEALTATVAEYNEMCANGEDTLFHKAAASLVPVNTEGSFYCVVGAPYCFATVGGLKINEELNVLDTEGNAITGLYACGEDSLGCLMSNENAYVTFGGAAQGWAWTSGYCLGEILTGKLN